jgi:hypothetical protein
MGTLGDSQAGRRSCLNLIYTAQMQNAATSDNLKDFVAINYSLKSHVSESKVSSILTNLVHSKSSECFGLCLN